MKTRTAFIYLAVLLILAGYFYYFEVVRHKAKTEEEEAALRLFQVDKVRITSLRLDKDGSTPIWLKKNGQWQIVEPINSRADEFAVGSLLTRLESLKMEREVETEAQDLEPYGLDKPRIHLSFLADDTRHHLRIGVKAVVGNHYYASGDQENRVVLLDANQQQGLDKSLFDLRSKEFFTMKSDEIDRVEIERAEGKLALTKLENKGWQALAAPELRIKSAKIEGLLSRLTWLRAKRFLENGGSNYTQLGLDPARIRISLSEKEKTETLLLGKTKKGEGVYAKGGGLPGVAMVDEKLLEELPDSLSDLEDRALLSFALDQVKAVNLEVEGETGRLERHGEKWKWAGDGSKEDPENWRVNSLLWEIQELEYLPESSYQEPSSPDKKQLALVLFSENENQLGTFILAHIPGEEAERGTVWFFEGDQSMRPYLTSAESLRNLHENAKKLISSGTSDSKS